MQNSKYISKQRKFIGWPAIHIINKRRKARKVRSALIWNTKFNNN